MIKEVFVIEILTHDCYCPLNGGMYSSNYDKRSRTARLYHL